MKPHRSRHSRELGAGSSRRERKKAPRGYLGVPAPGESSPAAGRAGPAEKPPGRCCGGWQGVGTAGLTSEAATSCLGLPARRRKRLLIPHTHEVLPYLAQCHISATASPSLPHAGTHRRTGRKLSSRRTALLGCKTSAFCSGREHPPPLQRHMHSPQLSSSRKPPSFRRLALKYYCT